MAVRNLLDVVESLEPLERVPALKSIPLMAP